MTNIPYEDSELDPDEIVHDPEFSPLYDDYDRENDDDAAWIIFGVVNYPLRDEGDDEPRAAASGGREE